MKKKKVLIGYDDFVALLENGGYFVDKSLLIKELIDNPNQVTLITRPRRFVVNTLLLVLMGMMIMAAIPVPFMCIPFIKYIIFS